MNKLDAILPLLRCPRTGAKLERSGDKLFAGGNAYPIVNGKPVLVRTIELHHVTPPAENITSRNHARFDLSPEAKAIIGRKLHLGCGDVPSDDPDVISADVLPTGAADVVCEAEALPFADGSLSYVYSSAVFEHVYDPVQSAREVRRVLREGGELYVDTAFLQGYHGFPSHYFNMTSQAVETFIADDFELLDSRVPRSGNPFMHLQNVLARLGTTLPGDSFRFSALADEIKRRGHDLDDMLHEHMRRSLATCFVVHARKPVGYDPSALTSDKDVRMKRAYYSGRVAIIERHYEIGFYADRALEKNAGVATVAADNLNQILAACKVSDPTQRANWQTSIDKLHKAEQRLRELRDVNIRAFLN